MYKSASKPTVYGKIHSLYTQGKMCFSRTLDSPWIYFINESSEIIPNQNFKSVTVKYVWVSVLSNDTFVTIIIKKKVTKLKMGNLGSLGKVSVNVVLTYEILKRNKINKYCGHITSHLAHSILQEYKVSQEESKTTNINLWNTYVRNSNWRVFSGRALV